jgi:hypothetical protein
MITKVRAAFGWGGLTVLVLGAALQMACSEGEESGGTGASGGNARAVVVADGGRGSDDAGVASGNHGRGRVVGNDSVLEGVILTTGGRVHILGDLGPDAGLIGQAEHAPPKAASDTRPLPSPGDPPPPPATVVGDPPPVDQGTASIGI